MHSRVTTEAFWLELEKIAVMHPIIKKVKELGKTISTPQVSKAAPIVKPPTPASNSIKVPSTISADAGTALNTTGTKSIPVGYR